MSTSGTKNDITPAQCRAARGLIGWSQDHLAAESGVSKRSIVRFELDEANPHESTLEALQSSLREAGVIFIDENGDGPGVRLKKRKKS